MLFRVCKLQSPRIDLPNWAVLEPPPLANTTVSASNRTRHVHKILFSRLARKNCEIVFVQCWVDKIMIQNLSDAKPGLAVPRRPSPTDTDCPST